MPGGCDSLLLVSGRAKCLGMISHPELQIQLLFRPGCKTAVLCKGSDLAAPLCDSCNPARVLRRLFNPK